MEEVKQDSIQEYAVEVQKQIEEAIKEAILKDYDGVDLKIQNRTLGLQKEEKIGSEYKIEFWNYPEPQWQEGYKTIRYSWRWFDQEELRSAIKEGRLEEVISKVKK